MLNSFILGSCIGCATGVLYGVLLLLSVHMPPFYRMACTITRLFMTAGIFYYLLHFSSNNFIIILISYMTALWLVILVMKDRIQ